MRIIFPVVFLGLITAACGGAGPREELAELTSEVDAMLDGEVETNPFDRTSLTMPDGGRKIHINPVGGTLGKVFNDSNHLHLDAAREIGISPVASLADIWAAGEKLVRIKSCADYYVEPLTHSVPYLVPEAKTLLADIGRSFNDSLRARGGGDYRIKVTSVTRTPASVKKLKRGNVNASDNSAHQYGTTFDISYSKFVCDSTEIVRTQEDMKNLLAEILKAERDRGRCFVKYERKQSCFHITVRPESSWKNN